MPKLRDLLKQALSRGMLAGRRLRILKVYDEGGGKVARVEGKTATGHVWFVPCANTWPGYRVVEYKLVLRRPK